MSKESTTVTWSGEPPVGEARLQLSHAGTKIVLATDGEVARYGRGRENEFVVEDDYCSRSHGEVTCRQGRFLITDRSRNGTILERAHGPLLYVHKETVLLESEGKILLGRAQGPAIQFLVEVRPSSDEEWGAATDRGADTDEVPSGNQFLQEGEYWTLAFDGTVLRMRDAKGLHLLRELLAFPHEDLLAVDLAQRTSPSTAESTRVTLDVGLSTGDGGDAGPMLDEQAKAAYRARVRELRADLEEAEAANDLGRAESLREEIDVIGRELSKAVGLGGRDRASGSVSERARLMVTVAIKRALEKIDKCHAPLGEHLRRSIKTGRRCSYDPGSNAPDWTL